jgi:hypothetical protein
MIFFIQLNIFNISILLDPGSFDACKAKQLFKFKKSLSLFDMENLNLLDFNINESF